MGPIRYALCQKPVIGVVMWLTTLCGFPPLFMDEPIDLSRRGSMIVRRFQAPVEKRYTLVVSFEFPGMQARITDDIVGKRYGNACESLVRYEEIPPMEREGLGRPIPFRVIIRKAEDRSVVVDRMITSLCAAGFAGPKIDRTIGWLALPIGEYIAEVTNLESQQGLQDVKTTISLYAGAGK